MAIYPEEAWPAESTVAAVDGTTDLDTGLPFIAKGTGPTSSPSYEIQYNRRQMRQNRIMAAVRQGMVVDEGGLKIGVYPIEFTAAGQRKSFPGLTGLAVPDNVTRVVYLDASANLQLAANWPAGPTSYLPLAEVTSLYGMLTIHDRRSLALFQATPAPRQYLSAGCAQVVSNQSNLKIFEFDLLQDVTLEQVQVFCTSATAGSTVDVRRDGISVLSAPIAPLAGSVVRPVIATPELGEASALEIYATTDGSGSIGNLQVTAVLRG